MTKPLFKKTLLSVYMLSSSLFMTPLLAADTISEAFAAGKADINFRYRLETVEQDNALEDATAATLRTRFGYTTGSYKDFTARLEFEYLNVAGSHDYNSTQNGLGQYSVVADPRTEELNQAWIDYSGIDKTSIKLGRQRIILDNARFIGNVGWRQNEQTFDALLFKNTSFEDVTITLGNIFQINRIFTTKQDTSHNILNIGFDKTPIGKVSTYAYMLDYDTAGATSDHTTIGLRLKGAQDNLLYTAEYAQQSDSGDSTADFSPTYTLLEAGYKMDATKLFIGQETLGSDNGIGFATPLATAHAFNGWADQFLGTPGAGLNDLYIKAVTKFAGMKFVALYHDFSADTGSTDYGTELDLLLVKPVSKNVKALVKFADFSAETGGGKVDTQKIWLALEAKFSQ